MDIVEKLRFWWYRLFQIGDVAVQLDPIHAALPWAGVQAAIRAVLPSSSEWQPSRMVEAVEATVGNMGLRELDQEGRVLREQKKAFAERGLMAIFGGAALIGPMLIMTLHPSRNTSLITVSVATFLFAIALTFGATDSTGKDVLAATAAYAAVLVVFVGTSTSTT